MSVTLQIKLNGGAPQTGGVTGAIGDVVQLTAANKSTWSGAARWEVYDYPPSFTVPAGWTADGDGVFYALGNADPPAFTISDAGDWGKYGFRVTVLDGGILTTDEATALSIPSPGGLKSIMAGESTQFGGTREKWVGDLKRDIRTLSAGSGTVAPTADTVAKRDAAGELYATSFKGGATGSTTVEATGGSSDATVKAGRNIILDHGTSGAVAIKNDGDTGGFLAALAIGECALAFDSNGTSSGFYVEETSTTIRADTKALTCEEVASVFTMTGDTGLALRAGGPITVQPAQATSGAGPKLTLAGGPGQTPGTHLAGAVDIDQGTTVSNVSAATNFVANGTTRLSIIASVINGAFSQILQSGARGLLLDATDAGGSLLARASASLLLRVSTDSVINLLTTAATRCRRMLSNETTSLSEDFGFAVVVAASGSAQLATWSIPTNTSVTAIVICTVANRTNKRTSSFHRRFVAQNDAGSGSDNGADVAVVADSIGAGEAGLTVTLDRSGTTLRLNRNTPDADSREFRGIVLIHFSSLT